MTPCTHGTCVTCSDTAVAVTILELLDDALAVVDTGEGARETVSVALVPGARVGDTILVHAGEAIGRIPDVVPDIGADASPDAVPDTVPNVEGTEA